MDYAQIIKLLGEIVAGLTALTTAVIGLCSIIVKLIPILRKDHPLLPAVKFLAAVALNTPAPKDEDRPMAPPTTPTQGGTPMKAVILLIALFICGVARADVSIGDTLKKLPGLKQGIAYSVADQKINYLTTIDVFQWKDLSLEVGYAGRAENTGDKIVAVASYDVANMKKLGVKVPIVDLLDFRVGIYGGIGRIEVGDFPTMRGNNETDYGVSLTAISVKF